MHFTQAAALERAQALTSINVCTREEKDRIAELIGGFRFSPGFGKTLSRLVKHGIGVHHAGMLPKYRRLVEQLAQAGLLKVICGTDTLGVGINVPIRTVVFTGLSKYDGRRQRLLKAREFHQIAGRAGRAGFDTAGTVVVQAPEHVVENARLVKKAGDDPKKLKRVQRKKAPEGQVTWTEETFERLVAAEPEALVSRMRVSHAMLLNVIARPGDPAEAMRRLLRDNHEDPRSQLRLMRLAAAQHRVAARRRRRRAARPARGRTAVGCAWPRASSSTSRSTSRCRRTRWPSSTRSTPRRRRTPSTWSRSSRRPWRTRARCSARRSTSARGEAIGEMKAEGIEYDERMELLEEVTWPKPLQELLEHTYELYRQRHPWVAEDALSPKSVVRDMYERAMTFAEYVAFYGLTRSEGLVLRYLGDAYRALRQTVPEQRAHRRARGHHRVARRRRAPDRLEPARRVGAAQRPRPAGCRVAAPDVLPPTPERITANERAFTGAGAQRDVPAGGARRARTAGSSSASSRPRPARRIGPEDWREALDGLLRRARRHRHRPRRARPADADRREGRAHAGRCSRSSATPTATTTGGSSRPSTSPPPTTRASWSST